VADKLLTAMVSGVWAGDAHKYVMCVCVCDVLLCDVTRCCVT